MIFGDPDPTETGTSSWVMASSAFFTSAKVASIRSCALAETDFQKQSTIIQVYMISCEDMYRLYRCVHTFTYMYTEYTYSMCDFDGF